MSRLYTFFKGADTEFGVFYPNHYLLAVFSSLADADQAKDELRHAGRGDEDVISVSGDEVVQFAEDHLLNDGLWGGLMAKVPRMFGTEARYADNDLAAAKGVRRSWPCTVPLRDQAGGLETSRAQASLDSPLLFFRWN